MRTLRELGLNIVGFHSLADHVRYQEADLSAIFVQARQAGATGCITTEKDMVKLRALAWPLPIHALRMEASLDEQFQEFVAARLKLFR